MQNLTHVAATLVRLLPAETAHRATIRLARVLRFLPPPGPDDPRLAVSILGQRFPNPVGLAAGFDKDAEILGAMSRLGFGFVECGTVTPLPQMGNLRPRLFRLSADRAVINRMGFNNDGMERASVRLARRRGGGIVGVNIGANKYSSDRIGDYAKAFVRLAPLSDYVAINVSSPNTPGLRGLQNRDELTRLLSTLTETRARLSLARSAGGGDFSERLHEGDGGDAPILLKIAPDLDDHALDEIADVSAQARIEGLIVSNTTLTRPPLKSEYRNEAGGLSGRPLFESSTRILKGMHARLGTKLVLIGVGGISSGADAYAKIRAGASLVQLYTALVYEGPGLVARIKRELLECLARDGFASVADAVGADFR